VFFDFDNTLNSHFADQDLLKRLAPSAFADLQSIWGKDMKQWNPRCIEAMKKLSSLRSETQIKECLERMPFEGKLVLNHLRKNLMKAPEMHVVSDSNTFIIDTILRKQGITLNETGMRGAMRVHSNPCEMVSGELRMGSFQKHSGNPPHGCMRCSENMCKGEIVTRVESFKTKRAIYVGDGPNDVCPSLAMRSDDLVFARKGQLWDILIGAKGDSVAERQACKASVTRWDNHEELLELFKKAGPL